MGLEEPECGVEEEVDESGTLLGRLLREGVFQFGFAEGTTGSVDLSGPDEGDAVEDVDAVHPGHSVQQ